MAHSRVLNSCGQPLPVRREISIEIEVKPQYGRAEVPQSNLHGDDIVPLDQTPHGVLTIVGNVVAAGCQAKSMDVIG